MASGWWTLATLLLSAGALRDTSDHDDDAEETGPGLDHHCFHHIANVTRMWCLNTYNMTSTFNCSLLADGDALRSRLGCYCKEFAVAKDLWKVAKLGHDYMHVTESGCKDYFADLVLV